MKKNVKKWLKPLIGIIIVIAALIIAYQGITGYLASRSVAITPSDIIATLITLKSYLIAAVVVVILAILACIVTIKLKKHIRFMVHGQALVATLLAVVVIVNMICMGPEYSLINNAMGDKYYISEDTIAKSEELTESIASEGIVLLKNDDNALPLENVDKLNVFGWSSTNPIYGGTGSGSVDESKCVTLLQGLEDAGFETNTELSDFYTAYRETRPNVAMNAQDWTIPEPTMEEYDAEAIFENAKEFSDTALIVIGRSGGENADLPTSIKDEDTYQESEDSFFGGTGVRYSSNPDDIDPEKSYLELSNREIALVDRVTSEFNNVIVVINSSNAMECGWLDEYDSINGALWCAGAGQTGFAALGKILSGEVNPSGKLPDTYVYDLLSIPVINNIGDFEYANTADIANADGSDTHNAHFLNYSEGIYVGYKFYETAAAEGIIDYDSVVQFPFGYGLSYTTFEQTISSIQDDGTTVTLNITVKNTGDTAGKDVVEVYYTPPYTNGGIEKSEVNLVAYEKTGEIAPGTEESVTLSFEREDMASYDYLNNGCYVLEQGNYNISIRSDSHTVLDSRDISVERDYIYNDENDGARESDQTAAVNQFDYAAGDVTYLSRADHFANLDDAMAAPEDYNMPDDVKAEFYSQATYDSSKTDDSSVEMPVTEADNGLEITDMTGLDYDDPKWEDLLDQLSVDEMNSLIANGGYAVSKVDSIGLPAMVECDGPAAIKNNFSGVSGTAFPSATMIAATWNKELAQQRGELMGLQCQEMNVIGWYGPAMNIHRTAFSGRNFEYYSEDGVLSGYTAASEVAGAREYGIQTYIKHFALNDQETNRTNMLCTWSNEQAIREIYLKPFELAVKVGGANAAMTSFNYIGARWAGETPELLQTVLRDEWGFVGATVTDWFSGSSDGFMMADSAIRAGGDKMLSSQGDQMAFASDTDNPATVTAMRNAAHNILYGVANSNAMDERNFTTPGWVKTFIGVDVAIGVVLILIEAYTVYRFMKLRKKVADTVETEK